MRERGKKERERGVGSRGRRDMRKRRRGGEGEGKGCRKQGEEGFEEEEKRGRRWRRKEVR